MFAREVQTRRHLAVVDPPHRPGVLTLDAYRLVTLLREPGVIDHERIQLRNVSLRALCDPTKNNAFVPAGDCDRLLDSLAHRLGLANVVHQSLRDRLDALPFPVEQQAQQVTAQRVTPLSSSEALEHLRHPPLQLDFAPLQVSLLHPDLRSQVALQVDHK